MKYFLILIFGSFFVTLFCCFNSKEEDYEKLGNVITTKTANRLRIEKGLYLIGTGGQMMDDIQIMGMGFEFFHPIDIKKGRELLLFSIEEYLNAINCDEKIRPYLHQYPFTAKNIEMQVWIRNSDGSRVPLDKIYYISAIDGILTYYTDDPEKYWRKTVHKETYEEALQEIADRK